MALGRTVHPPQLLCVTAGSLSSQSSPGALLHARGPMPSPSASTALMKPSTHAQVESSLPVLSLPASSLPASLPASLVPASDVPASVPTGVQGMGAGGAPAAPPWSDPASPRPSLPLLPLLPL